MFMDVPACSDSLSEHIVNLDAADHIIEMYASAIITLAHFFTMTLTFDFLKI